MKEHAELLSFFFFFFNLLYLKSDPSTLVITVKPSWLPLELIFKTNYLPVHLYLDHWCPKSILCCYWLMNSLRVSSLSDALAQNIWIGYFLGFNLIYFCASAFRKGNNWYSQALVSCGQNTTVLKTGS